MLLLPRHIAFTPFFFFFRWRFFAATRRFRHAMPCRHDAVISIFSLMPFRFSSRRRFHDRDAVSALLLRRCWLIDYFAIRRRLLRHSCFSCFSWPPLPPCRCHTLMLCCCFAACMPLHAMPPIRTSCLRPCRHDAAVTGAAADDATILMLLLLPRALYAILISYRSPFTLFSAYYWLITPFR